MKNAKNAHFNEWGSRGRGFKSRHPDHSNSLGVSRKIGLLLTHSPTLIGMSQSEKEQLGIVDLKNLLAIFKFIEDTTFPRYYHFLTLLSDNGIILFILTV